MSDKNINFYEELEGHYIIERSDVETIWHCQIGDKIIPLVLSVRAYPDDEMGYDVPEELEEFEGDLHLIDFEVMVHKDHICKSFLEGVLGSCGMGEDFEIKDLMYFDIMGYGGGVTHVQPLGINPNSYNKDYFVKDDKGNIYMKDLDFEELKKFTIERVPAIFGLIGFILDRQTRRIGTTGWDEINQFIKGTDSVRDAMNRCKVKRE